MNDRVAINSRDDDSVLCYDNYAVSRNSPIPVRTTLILVQPKILEREDHENWESSQNSRNLNEKSIKYSNISSRSSLSSNSIEEVDIGVANISSKFYSIHNFNNNSENYHRRSINVFDEEILASYAILNPIPGINIIDPKEDLFRFLLTPPPRNVVMKCQIVKSNTIDKTLLFTNFIFSLQMSDADGNFKRHIQHLMIAHPNRNPKNFAYVISTDSSNIGTTPPQIIGQLKSNFIGTRFNILCQNDNFISNEVHDSNDDSVNEDLNSYSFLKSKTSQLGVIFYKNSRFGSGKPRKLEIIIPAWNDEKENYDVDIKLPKERKEFVDWNDDNYIKLENVNPDYDEDQKCYTVDFGGRVKEISVKNFALTTRIGDRSKRVYQFGKCKNHYIVDFTYPLCPFQAFAIGISSLQRKIGTE